MTTAITPRRRNGYGTYVNGANALALDYDTMTDAMTDETATEEYVAVATVDTPTRKSTKAAPAKKATTKSAKRARKAWVTDVTPAQPESVPLPIALPRAPFLILMVGLVVVGVLGVLVLNTKINENSFRLNDLRSSQANLDLQEQQLSRALADLESPGNLRAAATRLGLVPAGTPAFINLPDGRVVGVPQPAVGR